MTIRKACKKHSILLAAGLGLAALLAAGDAIAKRTLPTITDIVAKSGGEGQFDRNKNDYDLLLNAVLAAGLGDALADPEADLTVLAPNDRAFIRLAQDLGYTGRDEEGAFNAIVETLTILGNGDPIPVLTNVLLYHVLPESLSRKNIQYSDTLETLLDGANIFAVNRQLIDNDPDFINPRLRGRSNIRASNGFIHTINRVLIPADLPNDDTDLSSITEIVAASGDFDRNRRDYDILLQAVLAAGLEGTLGAADADVTVFAPNDIAFVRLARSLGYRGWKEEGAFNAIVAALTELGGGDPIPLLTDVLLYHVSPGTQTLTAVLSEESVTTLLADATIEPDGRFLIDGDPDLRDPRIVFRSSDLRASNGIIHTVNRVLTPVDLPNSPRKH